MDMLIDKQERHEAQAFSASTVFVAAVVAHIVVNFNSADGQLLSVSFTHHVFFDAHLRVLVHLHRFLTHPCGPGLRCIEITLGNF